MSDGLCRICAACRVASLCPPSQHAAPIVRMVMQGHLCRDGSGREESHAHGRRGSSGDDQWGLTRVDVDLRGTRWRSDVSDRLLVPSRPQVELGVL